MSKKPTDDQSVLPGYKIARELAPGRARDLVNYENGLRALIKQLDAEPDVPLEDITRSRLRTQGLERGIKKNRDGDDA